MLLTRPVRSWLVAANTAVLWALIVRWEAGSDYDHGPMRWLALGSSAILWAFAIFAVIVAAFAWARPRAANDA